MDNFSDYESFDGLGLANLVQNHIVTPEELLSAAIQRIEQKNPTLNAVIYKMYDEAYASIANIPAGSIFQGVPFLIKDLLAEFAGVPMRMGSRMTYDYIPTQDSEIIKRLKKSGLIILGKTNTPEFGLNPTTEPDLFGPTLNPWDLTRSPGGSSGGSAVAVAAGMVPIAHGADGAGSLRIPAAYCGVFGLKPSRGRTPTGPRLTQIWRGMVTEHVLTRSVRDSAAILDVLSGREIGSPISLPKPKETFLENLEKPLKTLRIGLTAQPFFSSQVTPEYKDYLNKAGMLCKELGHQVESVSFKIDSKEVELAFIISIAADTAATLKAIQKLLHKQANLLEAPTAVLCAVGESFTAADYAWAIQILSQVEKQSAEFFETYDILMTPTMPFPPPKLGKMSPDRFEKNILEVLRHVPYSPLLRKLTQKTAAKFFDFLSFTPLFNIAGQPAMSVPLFWDKEGLPVGIQFAAAFDNEKTLLQLAYQLEKAKPWAPVLRDMQC